MNDLESIARRLNGKKIKNNSYLCHCPAHSDKKASLVLSEEQGKILWHCKSGCSQEAVRSALGLEERAPKDDYQLKKTWVYKTPDGRPHLRISRLETYCGKKTFKQEHLEGSAWVSGGATEPIAPLYYDEWRDEPLVFLVEGEKCADSLMEKLEPAAAIPGGSNAWKPEYAKFFKGKRVVILPDKDSAGLQFAQRAYRDLVLGGAIATIRNLEGLTDKEDIYDWLKKGGNPKTLYPPKPKTLFEEIGSIIEFNKGHSIDFNVPLFDDALGVINPSDLILLTGSSGEGKCLGKGTPILMFDGSIKPVEEVKNGDLVMGPDSSPRKVSGVTKGRGPLYEVMPVKGDSWVCNDVHMLTLKVNASKTKKGTTIPEHIVDMPLNEYQERYGHCSNPNLRLFKVGVSFPAAKQDVPAYIAGIWLGDGHVHEPCVTKNDEEVLREWEKWGTKQRIPKNYLIASRKQRLELLAGLIDTDGYLSHSNFEFSTKYEGLKDDVVFLAGSLGFAIYPKKKVVKGRDYWRMVIIGDCSLIPTKVPRKKAPKRRQIKDHLKNGFITVPLGVGDYYGFCVDKDHRFLLGDFTVTHNTQLSTHIATQVCKAGKRVTFFSLESFYREIETRIIYASLAQKYFEDTRRNAFTVMLYRKWINGDKQVVDVLNKYLPEVEKEFNATYGDRLNMVYRDSSQFTIKEFEQFFKAHAPASDLIIIDHLNYFDSHDEKKSENKITEEVMKRIRDCVLITKKPVMLLTHVRKKDARERKLLPDIEDIHGSSNIFKIATKAIMIGIDFSCKERDVSKVLVKIPKDRYGEGTSRYAFRMDFHIKSRQYGEDYEVGRIVRSKEKEDRGAEIFEPLWGQDIPLWVRGKKKLEEEL